MIPFEKSEAETRERGAVLSPSCAQRKCIFFVAQGGSASRGRRSPFSKKRFATLGSFIWISCGPGPLRWPYWTWGHRFSSSLPCLCLPFAPTQDATRPSPEESATVKGTPKPAPSVTPKSKPKRRRRVTHVVARCAEPRHSAVTVADGRRFANASSFSTPTVRNA